MTRWVGLGVLAALVYALVAASVYQRRAWSYNRDVQMAGYRLDDAEEGRREVAQKFQITTGKDGGYERDPAYLAAQAKVDQALNNFPKASGLEDLRSTETRIGLWGVGAYLAFLLSLAARKQLAR